MKNGGTLPDSEEESSESEEEEEDEEEGEEVIPQKVFAVQFSLGIDYRMCSLTIECVLSP